VKDGKKLWKMKNTSINLYCINFFNCNKNIAKIGKNFGTDLIISNNIMFFYSSF